MKKLLSLVLAIAMVATMALAFTSCKSEKNAYEGLTILESDLFETEEYGIAFRKGSTMAKEVDAIIAELVKDGTVAEIAEKYEVSDSLVKEFSNGASTATDTKDFDAIKAKGKLVIGTTVWAPMNYKDGQGKWVGFDTELAEKVCEKLGVTAEFREIDWDNKLFELEAGTIDCIWNGMTITPAISSACEVSGAYMINGQVIVIKEGAFANASELAGKQVAVEGGSAGEQQATEKLTGSTIKPVGAQTDALLEVKAGTSSACVIDYVMAKSLLGK
ncbi:MAG: transporter substrate-binding domain-containing protein [Clostridia bacterium]|nr:transporter substrate-binding domain-containing protein [Clostridia bacterium]